MTATTSSSTPSPSATAAPTVVPVGALYCQRHPFDRTLSTIIVSVEPHPKDASIAFVTTADTVLFPLGGGQPADRGTLTVHAPNSSAAQEPLIFQVTDVQRKGTTAIHTIQANNVSSLSSSSLVDMLQPGTQVQLDVDWPRRWDAMQQHSGQHLLSAVAEQLFGWRTASWAFGSRDEAGGGWSSVEFAPDFSPTAVPVTLERVRELEDKVAEYIEQGLVISVTSTADSDSGSAGPTQPTRTSAKTLPTDLAQAAVPIRTVHIHTHDKSHTLDANPCCGTHVRSTAQLGTVLLRPAIERVRGTNARVYFTFGSARVRAIAGESLAREIKLGCVLSCGPKEFDDKITKLVDVGKADRKRGKALVDALAFALVKSHLSESSGNTRYHATTDDVGVDMDMDLLLAMATALKLQQVARVYTLSGVFAGDTLGIVLVGPVGQEMNDKIAQVTSTVEGMRGGGGKGKPGTVSVWQGRLSPVSKQVLDKVKELFA
ncbi:hypothetical protein BCR44DRAFT_1224567 [Catenaria anguillulae PL171]|uniref:Threonyl/alanyl tRNA synthetase SAD domain-containing protein n=1 Tax=Catenaria anguillulae PL171 TaxID=765915 RepID=A0A1Y2HFZ3_9FUNG|nr:hypothetical protein BCR44DRAFT_1224567 [Catenaria anguillulae PL171]